MDKRHHPNWWLLYLTLPLMIGLLILAHQANLSQGQEQLAQVAIVLVCFGLMAWWVNANSDAIIQEHLDEMAGQRRLGRQPRLERSRRLAPHNCRSEPDQALPLQTIPTGLAARAISAFQDDEDDRSERTG